MPGRGFLEMKWLKYFGSALVFLLIVGTIPSVLLITGGLIAEGSEDLWYFFGKLVVYLLIIIMLLFVFIKLVQSARSEE
jgi:hypothetical protein